METHKHHSSSGRGYRRKSKGTGLSRPQKLNRNFAIASGIIGITLLLVAAFVAGRSTSRANASAPAVDHQAAAPASLSSSKEILERIDEALTLYENGSIGDGIEVLKPFAGKGHPSVDLLLARLDSARDNYLEAARWISSDPSHPATSADLHLFRAGLQAQSGSHPAAFIEYEAAARLAPLDAQVFLEWGQALREYGRTREGIQRLQQAQLRVSGASEDLIVRTRLLLARSEIEEPASLKAEAAPFLEDDLPDPAWLIAMAVIAFRENENTAAADFLDRAKARLPHRIFAALINDPVFTPYADSPAVRSLR